MALRPHLRILPHEIIFGLFMLVMWLRLATTAGFFNASACLYLVLLLINSALIAFCDRRPTPTQWRLRLFYYPIAMNLIFADMKTAVPLLHPERMDGWLQHLDAALFGQTPSLRFESLSFPALTDLMSFCYMLFFPYLTFSLLYRLFGRVEIYRNFTVGLFTLYGIGFLGYSLVPAQGPYLAMAEQFTVPLSGGWLTACNATLVKWGSNGVDVFPSLHCAISLYLLLFDRVHHPWRFRLYLAPCAGLWISTIYLRYHYAIDILCGFALAIMAAKLALQSAHHPSYAIHPSLREPARV